jgi:hypothetical protein
MKKASCFLSLTENNYIHIVMINVRHLSQYWYAAGAQNWLLLLSTIGPSCTSNCVSHPSLCYNGHFVDFRYNN